MSMVRRSGWYFVSSIASPLIGLITLPLYTTRLGPEQFGAFALGAALAGVVSAAAGSVSTISLPAELSSKTKAEKAPYLTAVLLISLAVGLITCLIVFGLYSLVSKIFTLEVLTSTEMALAIASAILSSFWGICIEILTVEGRAKTFSISMLLQALASVVGVSTALFVFDEVNNALFIGFLAASFVGTLSTVSALRRSIHFSKCKSWFAVAVKGGGAALMASLTENGKVAFERSYVGALLGTAQLGLFTHAQTYKSMVMVVLNAISRGVWPTALEEARDNEPQFGATLKMWRIVQAFVVAATLSFTLIGREFIGLLTHGKFVDSSLYVVALLLTLLLQTAAKPHSSILFSRGKGHFYAHLNTVSILIALLYLVATVPYIGVWSVISSIALQTLIHKCAVFYFARKLYALPFSDNWIVGGICAVGLCLFVISEFSVTLVERIGLMVILLGIIAWQVRPQAILRRLLNWKHQ